MATLPIEQKSSMFSCGSGGGGKESVVGFAFQQQRRRSTTTTTTSKKRRSSDNSSSTEQHSCEEEDYETIAKELNELSVQERERVLEEVHGVADEFHETDEFLDTKITEFDHAVADLSYVKRKELDRAFFLKPSIQKDTKFKIMFLRADEYDPIKAAERMAKFFTHKLSLFGEDKLVKDITLEDLEDVDIKYLESCSNLVLHQKDRAGRPIWFTYCDKYDFNNLDNMVRFLRHVKVCVC